LRPRSAIPSDFAKGFHVRPALHRLWGTLNGRILHSRFPTDFTDRTIRLRRLRDCARRGKILVLGYLGPSSGRRESRGRRIVRWLALPVVPTGLAYAGGQGMLPTPAVKRTAFRMPPVKSQSFSCVHSSIYLQERSSFLFFRAFWGGYHTDN